MQKEIKTIQDIDIRNPEGKMLMTAIAELSRLQKCEPEQIIKPMVENITKADEQLWDDIMVEISTAHRELKHGVYRDPDLSLNIDKLIARYKLGIDVMKRNFPNGPPASRRDNKSIFFSEKNSVENMNVVNSIFNNAEPVIGPTNLMKSAIIKESNDEFKMIPFGTIGYNSADEFLTKNIQRLEKYMLDHSMDDKLIENAVEHYLRFADNLSVDIPNHVQKRLDQIKKSLREYQKDRSEIMFNHDWTCHRHKGEPMVGACYIINKSTVEEIIQLMHEHEMVYDARRPDSRKRSIAMAITFQNALAE